MNPGFLYLLSEDNYDDLFYKGCVEKITQSTFKSIVRRLKKGGGVSGVRKNLPILLKDIKH